MSYSITARPLCHAALLVSAVMAAALLLLDPPPLIAQANEMLGERVRVELMDSPLAEGTVLTWGPDMMSLRGPSGTMSFDWSEVAGVERYRTRRRTRRGLAIGSIVGAVAAGTHAGVTWEPCTFLCFGPQSRGGTVALAGLIGAAAGGLVGTLVGTLATTSSWEPIAVPSGSRTSPVALHLGLRWHTGPGLFGRGR